MWYSELEIAIIEKDAQKIGDLINSLPTFESVDEMKRAQYLLDEARAIIDNLREEALSDMKRLKKHIDFLKSTEEKAPSNFDLHS